MNKWRQYKELLESSHSFLQEEFPEWLQHAQQDVPDTTQDAQQQRDTSQAELDKLQAMKQELHDAALRCSTTTITITGGSSTNTTTTPSPSEGTAAATAAAAGENRPLDNAPTPTPTEPSALLELADSVNKKMHDSIGQLEKRMDRLHDIIRRWDHVDHARMELRQWLHCRQGDLQVIEDHSVHTAEDADTDLQKLRRLRDEVHSRGPAVEELLSQYRSLTQHNQQLNDPVIRAVHDDWEELLGQIDNLMAAREVQRQNPGGDRDAANSTWHQGDTMDEDLADYLGELERLQRADASTAEGARVKGTRKRCRSTQTRATDLLRPSLDSSTDNGDHQWRSPRAAPSPRGARGGGGGPFPSTPRLRPPSRGANLSHSTLPRSPFDPRHSHRRFHDSHQDLKKGGAAAAAALESESEESGYGDTYGETMHASSFDTHLDEPSYWMGSEAGRAGTPGNVFYESEDDESAASYITSTFLPVDPESLRDASSQTPGFARMQTMEVPPALNHSHRTQTPRNNNVALQTSSTSLHSIGAQTKRKSGSRADLLRSILLEVKDIKKQQGMDGGSDVESVASDATIRKETLEMLYQDVAALRNAGAQGTATTQTQQEQTTQTSLRMFPEGDAQLHARQERLTGMLNELRSMKDSGDNSTRPQSTAHSFADFDQRTPSRSLTRTTPARFESPMASPVPTSRASAAATPTPAVNGYHGGGVRFAYPPETSHSMPALNQQHLQPGEYGHRRVTQEDLNAISDRLDRLQSYQMPGRRQLPMAPPPLMQPPPPSVMFMPPPPPPPLPPPRRYRVRHFSRSYDDLDAMSDDGEFYGGRRRRRGRDHRSDVRGRYHLDDALDEAHEASRELKRMSSKMKRSLREELSKYD